jgi:hypothetical protein
MLEFIIESDEKISKAKFSIWISFDDKAGNNAMYICSGVFVFVPGDDNKCCFDFHFHHSADWREVTNMNIEAPAYSFSGKELSRLGEMVVCLINAYIAKHN